MTTRAPLLPSLVKVLASTGAWTLIFGLVYLSMYLLTEDLIDLGKLSGEYAFWPDFAGTLVVGVFAGLVGGTLLVSR